MSNMTDKDLGATVEYMVSNSVGESGSFNDDNEKYLSYYRADPFGNEVEGRSKVVSTDTRDLVEADMPSLARVFLGAGDPVEFKAVNQTPEAIDEAKDKQIVVSHIIANIPNSFRTQHDFLKASEIQKIAALEYGCEEKTSTRSKKYANISNDELTAVMEAIEGEKDVDKVEVTESTDDEGETFDATIRITYTAKEYFMRGVPVEDLIISRNATNKEDAEIIGKRFKKSRGELVSDGHSRKFVDSLPSSSEDSDRTTLKQVRYQDQGGEEGSDVSYTQWANQQVEGVDVYALVDFDGDGIAERRHIIKVGNQIIENEQFDHIPYALTSSMLMPYDLIGLPRAELTQSYQQVNSFLWRGTLDNMAAVNNPRYVYTDEIDVDELLDIQLNGVIHSDGMPANNIMPLVTPYVGDKNIQLIQYMEGKKSSSTGNLVGNQALEADQLSDETATRFEGMEQAGAAKIELVARVIAETGYKDLWEGIAWFANHFQDEELEIRVLGRPMAFIPTEWKYDHRIRAKVGTGAGDDEKIMTNLSAIFQAQTSLIQQGSTLSDDTKRYNTLAEMVRTVGRDAVQDFFNNPEQPEQIVTAERDMLKKMVQQFEAQSQGQNQLADAARVEAEGKIAQEQLKQKFQAQVKQMEMQQDFNNQLRDAMAQKDKDIAELQFKYTELNSNTTFDYSELEVKNGVDIPGEGQGD